MIYQISTISSTSTSIILPFLVDRLIHLTSSVSTTSSPSSVAENTEKEKTIITNLFSAGLGLGSGEGIKVEIGVNVDRVKWAVGEVGYRAGLIEGGLGEWVGKERRRWAWDEWRSCQ
jgi:nucleolar pre-ribosomal-associated protein 1